MEYMQYMEMYAIYQYSFLIYGKYIIHQHQTPTRCPPTKLLQK